MPAPIASSSSPPANTKTQKTPKKYKGKKKAEQDNVVELPKSRRRATVTVDPTTPAAHVASQGSSAAAAAAAAASFSDHSGDDDINGVESADFGDFDYDAVKADDGVELWLVRAPSTVRPVAFSLFRSPYPHLPPFLLLLVGESEEPARRRD